MCREEKKEEENPILEPKIADFDKSQKPNQTEFRDAVNGIVFIRSSCFQKTIVGPGNTRDDCV